MFKVGNKRLSVNLQPRTLGYSRLINTNASYKELESRSGMPVPGTGADVTLSNIPIEVDMTPMLGEMGPPNRVMLYRIYRDMYYRDTVAGPVADLFSILPFSDFSLVGFGSKDKEAETVFNDIFKRLNLFSYPREASLDYSVYGNCTSSVLYNNETKNFVDLMPYLPENISIQALPLRAHPPIIIAQMPPEISTIFSSNSKRIAELKEELGNSNVEKLMKGGNQELDPLQTIYLSRNCFSSVDQAGVSLFCRILPLYLIEKNLARGTLGESARRQRAISHVTLGDGEWEPQKDEMEYFSNLFQAADMDPLGGVMVTRNGVQIDEFRQGGDFWKVNEWIDASSPFKFRALNFSEPWLTGDASLSKDDNALSPLVDILKSHRKTIQQGIFDNKILPLISLIYGYKKSKKDDSRIIYDPNFVDTVESGDLSKIQKELFIPSIKWHKRLEPTFDSTTVDNLQKMEEKGWPVTLRMLAVASGINIEELEFEHEEDLKLRKKFKDMMDAIKKINPPEKEKKDDDMFGLSNIPDNFQDTVKEIIENPQNQKPLERQNILERDIGEDMYYFDTKGNKHHYFDQRSANKQFKDNMINAIKNYQRKFGTL